MTIFNYLFRGMNALVTAQICQLCGKVISGETDMESHIEQDEIARRIVRYGRRLRANKRSPQTKIKPISSDKEYQKVGFKMVAVMGLLGIAMIVVTAIIVWLL